MKKIRIGEKFTTNEGYLVEIIEYFSKSDCTIKFEDGSILKNKEYGNIKTGRIKNPKHRSLYGVGFLDKDFRYKDKNSETPAYRAWKSILLRCYDSKYHIKKPTYINCEIHESWHSFVNFEKWFNKNYIKGYHIDKDILIKTNKIYGPETCCFVPQEINSLFVKADKKRGNYPLGVSKNGEYFSSCVRIDNKTKNLGLYLTVEDGFNIYKIEKEKYIKEVAEKYRSTLNEECYLALINYKIEITD